MEALCGTACLSMGDCHMMCEQADGGNLDGGENDGGKSDLFHP